MSKNQDDQAPALAPVDLPAQAADGVTLDEFCTRLSKNDKRVELIGGFHYTEKAAGRIKAAEGEYQNRYAAFSNQPV